MIPLFSRFIKFIKRVVKRIKEYIIPPPPKMLRVYVGLKYAINKEYHTMMGFKYIREDEDPFVAEEELEDKLYERFYIKHGYTLDEIFDASKYGEIYSGWDVWDYDEDLIGEVEFEEFR